VAYRYAAGNYVSRTARARGLHMKPTRGDFVIRAEEDGSWGVLPAPAARESAAQTPSSVSEVLTSPRSANPQNQKALRVCTYP